MSSEKYRQKMNKARSVIRDIFIPHFLAVRGIVISLMGERVKNEISSPAPGMPCIQNDLNQ